ncbi:hypothetical protein [Klebsiella variicola]|uniref:hypothetical protein n=1 Tax=Klebsiella variicola TaxID=244366 RepID=UPI000E2D17EC|nr:hypothetical protein [Klebsiella variicola]SXE70346.1 Uncharacterised protein [Klebsiella variicola]
METTITPQEALHHYREASQRGYLFAMNKALFSYGCRHCCCLQISLPIMPGR